VGGAYRRHVEDGAKMKCQTRSARMIAAGGIDNENIGSLAETPDRFL
jgi:hypothetical protein